MQIFGRAYHLEYQCVKFSRSLVLIALVLFIEINLDGPGYKMQGPLSPPTHPASSSNIVPKFINHHHPILPLPGPEETLVGWQAPYRAILNSSSEFTHKRSKSTAFSPVYTESKSSTTCGAHLPVTHRSSLWVPGARHVR